MKMTGRPLNVRFRFMRRQVSKPLSPGITASMRTRSGVIWSMSRSALSPSVAINTVKPAWSSVSVRKPSVSGVSSTTRTVSRRTSGVCGSGLLAMFAHSFEHVHVALEIEIRDQRAHAGREGFVGGVGFHLAQLCLDAANVSDEAELVEIIDVV